LATAEDLQTISGIGKVFSERIIKFRNSIGGFTDKKQLNKVYGLEPEVIQKIWQIFYLKSVGKPIVNYIKKPFNTANETDLQKVNGIGEKLSKRIIKYRDKLGGFTIKEQLNDVYGLKPGVIARIWQQFTIKNPNKKHLKISLNDANIKELAENPYISYQLAKKIVSYRTLHGAFHNFADLLKINDFPKTKFKQITLFLKL
jgi:DNA uptake protein ComE-like DNA-binding protein